MTDLIPFAEPAVQRDGPLGWTEPGVNLYLESTREIAVKGRATINAWYRDFPDRDTKFLRRLRSTNDADHYGAVDELFIHECLRSNSRVEYEEGGKGPDFRLYRGPAYVAGVEVLSLFMRQDWTEQGERYDRIADEINRRVPADRWFVHFDVVRLDRTPAYRKLAEWLQQAIGVLPAHDRTQAVSPVLPHATYVAPGVQIEFKFIPRRPEPGAETDRIVGMSPVIGGRVNSGERLRTALRGKAGSRYDLRGQPFAVAVGTHDSFCTLDEIERALYGSVAVSLPSRTWSRANDGFFGCSKNAPQGRNRRVSCVFVVQHWQPWSPEEAIILRLDNPFAERPFPDELLVAGFRLTEVERDDQAFQFDWLPHRPGR